MADDKKLQDITEVTLVDLRIREHAELSSSVDDDGSNWISNPFGSSWIST